MRSVSISIFILIFLSFMCFAEIPSEEVFENHLYEVGHKRFNYKEAPVRHLDDYVVSIIHRTLPNTTKTFIPQRSIIKETGKITNDTIDVFFSYFPDPVLHNMFIQYTWFFQDAKLQQLYFTENDSIASFGMCGKDLYPRLSNRYISKKNRPKKNEDSGGCIMRAIIIDGYIKSIEYVYYR